MGFERITGWLGDVTGISSGQATAMAAEERLRLGLRRLCGWLLVGFVVGMACVTTFWAERRMIALLWALAVYSGAFLVGFLFGIPRVLQGDEAGSNGLPAARLRVNTNLEQVSDWLVKILVGLGLTELKGIGAHISRAAAYLSPSLYADGGRPLTQGQVNAAGALVIYFSVLGFLTGYLITRLLLGTLFRDADERTISPGEEMKILRGSSLPSEPAVDMKLDLDPKAAPAAKKIAKLSLADALREGIQPEALAVAKLNAGEYDAALQAYEAAVARTPNDPQLLLNYALALHQAGRSAADAVTQLARARSLLTQGTANELKWQVYRYLTFFSLYLPPPESFERTIEYALEYVSAPENRPSAAVYLNLACAYGQKAKTLAPNSPEFLEVRGKALQAVEKSIALGSSTYKARCGQLLHPTPLQKDQHEDDLDVFAGDPDFERLLS